jgi:hypothetical protein
LVLSVSSPNVRNYLVRMLNKLFIDVRSSSSAVSSDVSATRTVFESSVISDRTGASGGGGGGGFSSQTIGSVLENVSQSHMILDASSVVVVNRDGAAEELSAGEVEVIQVDATLIP